MSKKPLETRIREYRQRCGYSIARLAIEAGCSISTVTSWERATSPEELENRAINTLLNCSIVLDIPPVTLWPRLKKVYEY